MDTQQTQMKLWKFDEPITHWDVLTAFKREGEWYSRREVASVLRCAKSPSLIRVMTDLAAHGFLHIENFPLPNGVDFYKYRLTERGLDAILHGGFPPAFEPAEGGLTL